MKIKYELSTIEIIRFGMSDVIETSGVEEDDKENVTPTPTPDYGDPSSPDYGYSGYH